MVEDEAGCPVLHSPPEPNLPLLHRLGCTSVEVVVALPSYCRVFHPGGRNEAMLKLQFDGDVLVVQPEGPITRENVATLTRMADEYVAGHPKIAGVMVKTRTFPDG